MVNLTSWPLYSLGRSRNMHWIGWIGLRTGLEVVEKIKFLTLPVIEHRLVQPVAYCYTD
jgi:hypothetical protein